MARIVITGAGVAGLLGAMTLAQDGHDVTVLERDAAEPPAPSTAWEEWERRGVNQFRLLHFFQPRFRLEVEQILPKVAQGLERAGALSFNFIDGIPTEMTGGSAPGDDDFAVLTGRRPVVEAVLAAAAGDVPGLSVRRGVAAQALVTGAQDLSGVPHVTGVRSEAGEEFPADLVVDAGGRRSSLPGWLADAGARPPVVELEDSGFVYYGRHFRSLDGSTPPQLGALLQPYGSVSSLTLPADNGTWGVGVVTSAVDKAMRGLRRSETFSAVVKSLPLVAHWLDGEPLDDDVLVMAKIEDRIRRFTVDGQPVATGVAALADAWACTNPSLGRGATLGLLHVLSLRDTLRSVPPDQPAEFARAWDDITRRDLEPWYRSTLSFDRHRLAEIDAIIGGEPYEPGDEAWDRVNRLQFSAGQDPDCLRATLRVFSMLRPIDDVFADGALANKVHELGADWREAPPLGPSRAELLSIASA